MDNQDIHCPICNTPTVSQCKCLVADRVCEKGHVWHRCPVHNFLIVRERATGAHAAVWLSRGGCTCKTTAEIEIIENEEAEKKKKEEENQHADEDDPEVSSKKRKRHDWDSPSSLVCDYCPHCGNNLHDKKKVSDYCSKCGKPFGLEAKYCGECGTKRPGEQ